MNDRRAYYYPVVAYAVLLVLVWVMSWLVGLLELFVATGWESRALVSPEGVRWAVRNFLPSLNDVPWGTIMIVVVIIGLLRGSGLKKALSRLVGTEHVSANQKRALLYAFFALLCSFALLFMSVVSPWNLLLGVSGGLVGSPLVQGWVMILFLCVFFVSMAYGFVYGNYRSAMDVVCSLGETFLLAVPALMAVVPAAGIVACLEYTGTFAVFEVLPEDVAVFADIVFAIPFLYMILLRYIEKKEGLDTKNDVF